jgi:hypothetical protein
MRRPMQMFRHWRALATLGAIVAGLVGCEPERANYFVGIGGTGSGSVNGCSSICKVNSTVGAAVNLTATSAPGSSFVGWGGALEPRIRVALVSGYLNT